jgi:hypothetical protein
MEQLEKCQICQNDYVPSAWDSEPWCGKCYALLHNFSVGKQPCNHYVPAKDSNAYAEWNNEHQCYKCGKLVSFCTECNSDHHGGGYEICI